MSKKPITRLVNRKPISITGIKTKQKEEGVFMSYTENIISQIVEAREDKEFAFICSQIQEFIEKENIDACFVINKTELIDCLQEHQKLKMQIADLEAKLAESEKESADYVMSAIETNVDLRNRLAEKDKEIEEMKQIISKYTDKLPDNVAFDIANDDIRYQIVSNLIDKNTNYRNQIKELRQAKTDLTIAQLEKVKELLLEKCSETYSKSYCGIDEDIDEIFDKQIKALRGNNGIH